MPRPRKKPSILERLTPEEAQVVLHRLIHESPGLAKKAEKIAHALLSEVSMESIADEVQDEVEQVPVEDLRSRAGRHAWGYVEPSEAAWELLEEAVAPFLDDIKRRSESGAPVQAEEVCKGVAFGLYRLRHRTDHEVLNWAPDFLAETALQALSLCQLRRKRGEAKQPRGASLFSDFIRAHIPDWESLFNRVQ